MLTYFEGRIAQCGVQPWNCHGDSGLPTVNPTGEHNAAAALHESEQRFRALVEGFSDLMVIGPDQAMRYVSPSVARMLGYEPRALLEGKGLDLFHPDDLPALRRCLANALEQPGGSFPIEVRVRCADGTWRVVESRIANALDLPGVAGLVVCVRDATERRLAGEERSRLEDRLRQAEKMEAVGQLAAGIAHDFNNLLTAIQGYGELALADLHERDPSRGCVQEIVEAAGRAAWLTRRLLAFSRLERGHPRPIDLNELVASVEQLLVRTLGEQIRLRCLLRPSLPAATADPIELEQVILNLALNARDAMPEGGPLTIATDTVELREAPAGSQPELSPGRYVCLVVSDEGIGMSAEVRSRAFEPFFTTKALGTGLGLASVWDIVSRMGGAVVLDCEEGKGTTVSVYLPASDEEPSAGRPAASARRLTEHGETVLVVEDDDSVRAFVCFALSRHGYSVVSAANALDAVALATDHERPIHLLLTDVILPIVSGSDLVARLTALRPGLRVLAMSGYAGRETSARDRALEGVPLLRKPFGKERLLASVREALEADLGQAGCARPDETATDRPGPLAPGAPAPRMPNPEV